MTNPEFSRRVRLDTIGTEPRGIALAADPDERARLAARFGLLSVERLEADCTVRRTGTGVEVAGRLAAAVTQACVASGDPVPATIDEPFALRFVPDDQLAAAEEEVELAEGDLDVIGYAGGAIDLGEAAAQTLALALDPFPRAAGADAALRAAGVLDEGEAGPFAALKALKKD